MTIHNQNQPKTGNVDGPRARDQRGPARPPQAERGPRVPQTARPDNAPHVTAQNHRLSALMVEQGSKTHYDMLPTLLRTGPDGPIHFSPTGMVRAAAGLTPPDKIADGRRDVAYMLEKAYRPGAENVTLVTWVRITNPLKPWEGVSPVFDTTRHLVRPEEVALLTVGYTSDRLTVRDGSDAGQAAVAILSGLQAREGVVYATPVAYRDLTCRARLMTSVAPTFNVQVEPGFMAVSAQMGFNLVDTLRRYVDPAGARYGEQAPGPLQMFMVDGPPDTDGAPTASVAMAARCCHRSFPMEWHMVWDGDARTSLSFQHLGPVSWDRDFPPTAGVFPWSVVEGNVLDANVMFGDVMLVSPTA